MVSWKFKSCPKCSGDMFIERDEHSVYEQCLLCCYRRTINDTASVSQFGSEPDLHRERAGANEESNASRTYRKTGRPSTVNSPGFQDRYTKIIERLSTGDISRREAARELRVGYATLKRLLDTPVC